MKLFNKRLTQLHVRKRSFFLSVLTPFLIYSSVNSALAGGKDDPLLGKVIIDQLEVRDAGENSPVVLAA